jgi:hypothetical protein
LIASMRAQPLATALLFPLALLVTQVYVQRQDVREARALSASDGRIAQIQVSGKLLDTSVAAYFEAIGELGLAERRIKSPGSFEVKPVATAQADVMTTREAARKALKEHAADIHSLHDKLPSKAVERYLEQLETISDLIDGDPTIETTGENITVLAKTVLARDALVNEAGQEPRERE